MLCDPINQNNSKIIATSMVEQLVMIRVGNLIGSGSLPESINPLWIRLATLIEYESFRDRVATPFDCDHLLD
jgi:hypothetical protein